jgi:hypothetical protein
VKDRSIIEDFRKCALKAYKLARFSMQQKMPLNNTLLQALSWLAQKYLGHLLSTDEYSKVDKETKDLQTDWDLPKFEKGDDAVAWWAEVFCKNKYPGLHKILRAAFSIFHGSQVESSFNVMGKIIIIPSRHRWMWRPTAQFKLLNMHWEAGVSQLWNTFIEEIYTAPLTNLCAATFVLQQQSTRTSLKGRLLKGLKVRKLQTKTDSTKQKKSEELAAHREHLAKQAIKLKLLARKRQPRTKVFIDLYFIDSWAKVITMYTYNSEQVLLILSINFSS